jgi:hypothetical protein
MSTKNTIRFEENKATRQIVDIYEDIFDEDHTYLAFEGFHFEAASSMEFSGDCAPRLTVKLPKEWAQRLGLIPLNVVDTE